MILVTSNNNELCFLGLSTHTDIKPKSIQSPELMCTRFYAYPLSGGTTTVDSMVRNNGFVNQHDIDKYMKAHGGTSAAKKVMELWK